MSIELASSEDTITEFYRCHIIKDRLANQAAMSIGFSGDSHDIRHRNIEREIRRELDPSDAGTIDIYQLTEDDMKTLGFLYRDGTYYLPLWIYPFLNVNTKLTDKNGETCIIRNGYMNPLNNNFIDYDIKHCWLSWGIRIDRSS